MFNNYPTQVFTEQPSQFLAAWRAVLNLTSYKQQRALQKCSITYWPVYRDGTHESTISLTFLEIILRFLTLEVPTFVCILMSFYEVPFMNKLEFSSLVLKPEGCDTVFC
jgi:hypothetical protein